MLTPGLQHACVEVAFGLADRRYRRIFMSAQIVYVGLNRSFELQSISRVPCNCPCIPEFAGHIYSVNHYYSHIVLLGYSGTMAERSNACTFCFLQHE
jgi:hypothetical protein